MDFERINLLLAVLDKARQYPQYNAITNAAAMELDKIANPPASALAPTAEPQPELSLTSNRRV